MLSWIGTICSIAGAFVVAFGELRGGYSLFLIGSLAWLTVAIERSDKPLGTLNLAFLTANLIGLTRAVL